MELKRPKEPTEIKDFIKSRKARLAATPDINLDSFAVWPASQNKLQVYLWSEWKSVLSPQGFTWPKFMKLLGRKTNRMVSWYQDMLSWDKLLNEIIEFVEGPYGKDLAKR